MKGKLIELCGIDGTGKTTICNLMHDSGYDAVFTREPYRRELATSYKKEDNCMSSYVFASDRHLHMRSIIIPELEKGRIVICDRGLHCNLAYQAYEGATMEWIMHLQSPIMVVPDLVIWLLGNPVKCAQRSGEDDVDRLAEIQKLYSKAVSMTPEVPVFTINVEHAEPTDIVRVIKKKIEELKR